MKKHLTAILLFVVLLIFSIFIAISSRYSTVMNIETPTRLQINSNNIKSRLKNETVCAANIEAFSLEPDESIKELVSVDMSGVRGRDKDAVRTSPGSKLDPTGRGRSKRQKSNAVDPGDIVFGKGILKREVTRMADFDETTGNAVALGTVIGYETSETRDKSKIIFKFDFSDFSEIFFCHFFEYL